MADPSVPTERTSLRAMIGGRWAVSWQGYLMAWPWAVLFIFSASPTVWASGTLLHRLLTGVVVGTLTYLPVGIVLWLASITLLRNRRISPAPIALVALIGGVAWTARSLAMISYLNLEDLPSDASPALRLGAGFIQGAIATVLIAWFLAKVTGFYEQRRRLLTDLVQEELANEQLGQRVAQLQHRVLHQVRQTVGRTIQSLDATTSDRSPSSDDVEILTQTTKRISQDLARDLWDDAASAARVNPVMVVKSTVMHRPFAYWALLPGALLGVIVLPIYWPFQEAVTAVATITLFAFIVSSVANIVCPRMSPVPGMIVYIATITLLLASAFVMHATIHVLDLDSSSGAGLLWAVAVNFGVFYPLMGVGAHIGRAQQDVLAQLRRSISRAEVHHHALSREESRMRRDLAMALHGNLQAVLTAHAMRAQHALDAGDTVTARQEIVQAKSLLHRSWNLPESQCADLQSTAHSVIESWEGIVDITLDITVSSEPAPRIVTQLEDVLLEGIGNAVRHGRAKNVSVTLDDHTGDLRVTITDDGVGVTGSRMGLGSAMLDEIAPNAWSLTSGSIGGSTLVLTLRDASTTRP